MTHGGLSYQTLESVFGRVIERAKILVMHIDFESGKFDLLDEPRHRTVTVLGNTKVNDAELRVDLRLAGDNTIRSWWRFEEGRITLKAFQIVYSFSGDPDGLTSPIGKPECLEMTEEVLSAVNKKLFSLAED